MSDALLDHVTHTHNTAKNWYPEYVHPDDLHQELATYTIEHADQLQKWVDDGEDHRVTLALKSVARIYGLREKARACGFEFEDVAWYSPETLAAIIPLALDGLWDGLTGEAADTGMPVAGGPANEGGTLLAMVLDVRSVLLPPRGHGKWLVSDFDPETEEGLLRLEGLAEALGGQFPTAPGYSRGSRKSLSNGQAQKLLKEQS